MGWATFWAIFSQAHLVTLSVATISFVFIALFSSIHHLPDVFTHIMHIIFWFVFISFYLFLSCLNYLGMYG
jgi:hypothetical protein